MQDLLFEVRRDFRVVRLTKNDAEDVTDHLNHFKGLVTSCEEMYPRIGDWLEERVIPGLRTPERVAFVGYLDEKPVVSAVVKRGKDAKFCHLKIKDELQDLRLGEVFMSLMTLEVRKIAGEIHFTLPESLWETKKEFFKSFGFHNAVLAHTQYRLFDNELRCSAAFSVVWKAVLEKLPKIGNAFSVGGYSLGEGLLLSIKPTYAIRIVDGLKTVEIRRKFSKRWEGHRVCLYASKPIGALVGEAKIKSVTLGKPMWIWEMFNSSIGTNKEEFDAYVGSAQEVYAIQLTDILPYKAQIPLSQLTHLLSEELRPPQSYCTLEKNKPWAGAVSVAALLHGSFRDPEMFALK